MMPAPPFRIYIGFDAREMRAWNVAARSVRVTTTARVDVERLAVSPLRIQGVYRRPTVVREGRLWDVLSDAPMSTDHAIARFLVPYLCGYHGWALFMDGDVLVRQDIADLFATADPRYAVQVVKHHHAPLETVKMDGQVQTSYPRKNWSSVMLFNCGHPANRALDLALVNGVPGRDLHRFCWLDDALIGDLPARWNVLVGHSAYDEHAAIVHFTNGSPDMPGYEHQPYAPEWYAAARRCGYALEQPALQVPA